MTPSCLQGRPSRAARPAPGLLLRVAAVAALAAAGCTAPQPPPSPHAGPVVLITLAGLRADAVGALTGRRARDLTPHLDALMAEADWAGAAVAPSSFDLLSLASYATGLGPWAHGTLDSGGARLDRSLRTLAEALGERGYVSFAYTTGPWFRGSRGWSQGFVDVRPLRGGRRAAGHLASLGSDRHFVWIHLSDPVPPYATRVRFLPRLELRPGLAGALPGEIGARELARLRDPGRAAAPVRREVATALYGLQVAHADERLGAMLAALRESGRWDETLVVVTSAHGEPGPAHHPHRLGRPLVEVPLVVKLPREMRGRVRWRVAVPRGERPAAHRLWATLVEAVGGEVPPGVEPSLFHAGRGGALSEVYLGNGSNEQSLVVGDLQLLRVSRFAAAEAGYHEALAASYGAAPAGPTDPATVLFGRLTAAFRSAPPFSGRGEAETTLLAWRGDGAVERVDDPARARALEAELARRWRAFAACERSPAAEAAVRRGASGGEGG